MSPFLFAFLILSIAVSAALGLLYSTHWELLATRKKLAESEARRQSHKPTWMQESGLDIQVGEKRVPLYKPFGLFEFTESGELHDYTLLRGNQIIEKKPLYGGKLAVCAGDCLYLFVGLDK